MNTYSSYKDSGVEWIGEIPSKWSLKKLKHVSKIVTGNTPPTKDLENYKNGTHLWVKPNEIKGFHPTKDTEEKLTDIGVDLSRVIPPFSVFVNGIGNIGEFGYSELYVSTNQQINSIVFNKKVLKKFGIYHTSFMKEGFVSNSEKVVVPILNQTKQSNLHFVLPTLQEQQHISNFLDYKTQKINTLIDKTKQKIELLKEQRTSLINTTVTKGLNSIAEMKDTGIEWIGKVPTNWSIKKLKYLSKLITDKHNTNENDIKISPENVESFTGVCFNLYSEQEGNGVKFKSGDILFNKLRLYLVKIIMTNYDGFSMGEMITIRMNKNVLNKYYFYTFFNQGFIDLLNSQSTGVKVPRVSPDVIMGSKLPLPPLSEQTEIINYLDEETLKIDKIIDIESRRIVLLKELRQSLIFDVVTGKVDIRNEVLA